MKNVDLAIRTAGDHLRDVVAGLVGLRVPGGTDGLLAGGEEPVFGKHLLELQDDGPAESEMRVAPESQAPPSADILVADVHASGESDGTVDDDDLAMVAEVDRPALAEARTGQRAGDRDAGVPHWPQKLPPQKHRTD